MVLQLDCYWFLNANSVQLRKLSHSPLESATGRLRSCETCLLGSLSPAIPSSLDLRDGADGGTTCAFGAPLRKLSPTPLEFVTGHLRTYKTLFLGSLAKAICIWAPTQVQNVLFGAALRKHAPAPLELATGHLRSYKSCFLGSFARAIPKSP